MAPLTPSAPNSVHGTFGLPTHRQVTQFTDYRPSSAAGFAVTSRDFPDRDGSEKIVVQAACADVGCYLDSATKSEISVQNRFSFKKGRCSDGENPERRSSRARGWAADYFGRGHCPCRGHQ